MISRSISYSSTPLYSQVRAAPGIFSVLWAVANAENVMLPQCREGVSSECSGQRAYLHHCSLTTRLPQTSQKTGQEDCKSQKSGRTRVKQWLLLPSWTRLPAQGKPTNIPGLSREGLRSPHSQPRSYWQVMGSGKGKSAFLRGVATGRLTTFQWMALHPGVHRKHKFDWTAF